MKFPAFRYLRKLMAEAGITIEALAKAAGVSASSLGSWLRGERPFPIARLREVESALAVLRARKAAELKHD